MCQALVTYKCGHRRQQKVHCNRSRNKSGLGNLLKYALFEEPCKYDIPKSRNKMCRNCEAHLDDMRDYTTDREGGHGETRERRSRGEGDGERRGKRHRDGREKTSDRSDGDRKHRRHREHRDKDKSSSSKSKSHKESHSERDSRRRHKKGREENRGRSSRPRSPMATIDESEPLPPAPPQDDAYPNYAEKTDFGDAEPEPVLRDDRSSINDYQEFIKAARAADAAQRAAGVDSPSPEHQEYSDPFSQADMLDSMASPSDHGRPSSSIYEPARANWQPQTRPVHPPARPPSSMYSQGTLPATTHQAPDQNLPILPPTAYHPNRPAPHVSRQSTRPNDSLPVPSVPRGASGNVYRDSDGVSWLSASVYSQKRSEGSTAGQATSTLPTSNNTTPQKSTPQKPAEKPAPSASTDNFVRPIFDEDPWSQDPIDAFCKKLTRDAREQLAREADEERQQFMEDQLADEMGDEAGTSNSAPGPVHESSDFFPGKPSRGHRPPPAGQYKEFDPRRLDIDPAVQEKLKPPMMHFNTYRDPNSPKPPPNPTPSSTGSQVFQHPREAPAPPGPADGLPLPSAGFNAHRLARQDTDNISHMTRWSDLCPPNVNSNIKVKTNEDMKATHNGKPVHVVNPDIVKKSWGKNADGPSAGKVSQRSTSDNQKKSKNWFSRFKPAESEASFGCADAKKHDSQHRQERPDSKRSNRSSGSKSKKKP